MALLAQDGIHFPVPQSAALIDYRRALIDRHRVGDDAALGILPLAVTLMALTQMAVQLATIGLVLGHVAVYPLMADRTGNALADRAYLLRTPICCQRHAHEEESIVRNSILVAGTSQADGPLVCLRWLITLRTLVAA